MHVSESEEVEKTLQNPDIHAQWEDAYRTAENEAFYEQAFDDITRIINAQPNSIILDVGCGICAHSIRLAKRGFSVLAVDFSESVLESAQLNLQQSGLKDKINLQRENILSLSFADRSFDYILCWGVLMHIPDIEKAISELDRVLKRDGILVIGENNMYSVQSIIRWSLRLLRGKEKANLVRTAAGLEYWTIIASGKLLTRYANIKWLRKKFISKGYLIKAHMPGQFSELYVRNTTPLIKNLVHGFNRLWFIYMRFPAFAFGNILIVQKGS